MTKTQAEIEELKANWRGDPCWDIEDTTDFEEHYVELLEYRLSVEAEWQKKEDERIATRAEFLKCSPELVRYLENLESKIVDLVKGQ